MHADAVYILCALSSMTSILMLFYTHSVFLVFFVMVPDITALTLTDELW